ncbi:hypothetical protein [Candidatus Methanocrinis natronophilus]|uniref:MarR family transcriptional regulator n=1 Tax=Candidatus Methanocrinis natronophilus TaxID=3033396 RepID=A0ABT5X7X9_9EURY|nr:hypothetical protein [Candidatus Methanocrinis natronophilus]MDF0590792.1 hypothetical protein [Candidatus Methanocrinis natronophilus]
MFEELLEVYKEKVAESERELEEKQAMIGLIMAVENMSGMLSMKQQDVDLLGRLIDQVDHLSKEVADLKSQMKTRQTRSVAGRDQKASDGYAMDKHTANLIDLLKERPGRYTTSDLVEMLGLNKTTVISVMKRAVEMDPSHVKLTQGKRRKLFLSYIPEDQDQDAKAQAEEGSEDSDKIRLELMSMT